MELLPCGHVASQAPDRACQHLLDQGDDVYEHVRLLIGVGVRYDACCAECDRRRSAGDEVELLVHCEGCANLIAEEHHGKIMAWRGEPGIPERPEAISQVMVESQLPEELLPAADIAPIAGEPTSAWMVLTKDGRVARYDADSGA